MSCFSCFRLIHSVCHCVHCGPSDTQFMERHSCGYLPTCRSSVEYKLYTRYAYSIGLSAIKVIYPADYSDWSSERVRSALWAMKFIWIVFLKNFITSSSLQRLVFMRFISVHLMTIYNTITSKMQKKLKYAWLFEMIVGVLTTCHTQYTWGRSICIFLFNRTTLQVFVTYLIKGKVFPLQARCGPEGG